MTNLIDNQHPRLILGLVSLRDVRDGVLAFGISSDVDFSSLIVDSGDDCSRKREGMRFIDQSYTSRKSYVMRSREERTQVLRDIAQVTLILEPRSSSTDVVGRAGKNKVAKVRNRTTPPLLIRIRSVAGKERTEHIPLSPNPHQALHLRQLSRSILKERWERSQHLQPRRVRRDGNLRLRYRLGRRSRCIREISGSETRGG